MDFNLKLLRWLSSHVDDPEIYRQLKNKKKKKMKKSHLFLHLQTYLIADFLGFCVSKNSLKLLRVSRISCNSFFIATRYLDLSKQRNVLIEIWKKRKDYFNNNISIVKHR